MARSQFVLPFGTAHSPEQSKHHDPPNGMRPKKLPAVLSGEEVNRLLSCVKCHKHRTFLVLQYACGLRLNEAAHLKISDIDSQRMQIRVDCGKGQKTRIVPMSPRLLDALREYWLAYRPTVYLFPGKLPETPLQPTTIQKMFKVAAKEVGILKNVTPHTPSKRLKTVAAHSRASSPRSIALQRPTCRSVPAFALCFTHKETFGILPSQ